MRVLRIAIISCFFFYMPHCFAQQVKTNIDRQDILIGEQIQYKVKANFPTDRYKVGWFSLPDSLAHFEVVSKSKLDTTIKDNITTLEQTITYTSFDSGRWNTPGLMINFDPVVDDTTVNLFTDSIPINVGYAPSDSTGLRDIKPVMDVNIVDYFWYYIGVAILLAFILAYFIWQYLKKRKKAPVEIASKLSAYEQAIQEMDKLKKYDLSDKEITKAYHTKLSEIFRQYVGRKQNKNLLNSTSSDVLIALSAFSVDSSMIATTASALRTGDAVKFAKYQPSAIASEENFSNIISIITSIERSTTSTK